MVWSGAWRSFTGRANRNLQAAVSGRDGGVDTGIDLGRHDHAPESLAPVHADLRFEIQHEEGVKDIAGQKGDQQEALDALESCL